MTEHVSETVLFSWQVSSAHRPRRRVSNLIRPVQEPFAFGTQVINIILWHVYVEPLYRCQKEALPRFPGDRLAMAGDRRAARGVCRLVYSEQALIRFRR